MFEVLLTTKKRSHSEIENFLERNLLADPDGVPESYNHIADVFWRHVFTINIDNVLDIIYNRSSQKRVDVCYPRDEERERDPLLDSVQVVYLHGKLPCSPEELMFSKGQYARGSLRNYLKTQTKVSS